MIDNSMMIINPTSDSGENAYTMVQYISHDTQYIALKKENEVYFNGHTSYSVLMDFLSGDTYRRFRELAITAINNRTRERNFARLNEMLSLGEISDETYDKIIDDNEDDYVVKCDIKPTEQDLKMVSTLLPDLKDVVDTDDLAVLFSFDESEVRKFIER